MGAPCEPLHGDHPLHPKELEFRSMIHGVRCEGLAPGDGTTTVNRKVISKKARYGCGQRPLKSSASRYCEKPEMFPGK